MNLPASRLFHAIVLMGTALVSLEGCEPGPRTATDAGMDADTDAAVDHDASTDSGWQPTK